MTGSESIRASCTYRFYLRTGTKRRQHRWFRRPVPVYVSKLSSATSTGETYRDKTVVLQNNSLAISQTLRDLPSLLAIQHYAAKVLVHGVVLVEAQAVLGDHIELAAED